MKHNSTAFRWVKVFAGGGGAGSLSFRDRYKINCFHLVVQTNNFSPPTLYDLFSYRSLYFLRSVYELRNILVSQRPKNPKSWNYVEIYRLGNICHNK